MTMIQISLVISFVGLALIGLTLFAAYKVAEKKDADALLRNKTISK